VLPLRRAGYSEELAELKDALGPDAFNAAWGEGEKLAPNHLPVIAELSSATLDSEPTDNLAQLA
jgi:hypothetical protein